MHQLSTNIPVVMTFSCNDPTGSGGIQADIETLFSLGCHCATVMTAVTAQDTCELKDYTAIPSSLVIEQARVVLEDIPVAAFKIGALGSIENTAAIHTLLTDYPNIPVVFKPSTSPVGQNNKDDKLISAIKSLLFPLTTLLVPDYKTAQTIIPGNHTLEDYGQEIMALGCTYVLLTCTHTTTPDISNLLFGHKKLLQTYTWQRFHQSYRGCSCTLSAALAGLLAQDIPIEEAVHEAQIYTWKCLKRGFRLGMGSQLPNRLFWLRGMDEKQPTS